MQLGKQLKVEVMPMCACERDFAQNGVVKKVKLITKLHTGYSDLSTIVWASIVLYLELAEVTQIQERLTGRSSY